MLESDAVLTLQAQYLQIDDVLYIFTKEKTQLANAGDEIDREELAALIEQRGNQLVSRVANMIRNADKEEIRSQWF